MKAVPRWGEATTRKTKTKHQLQEAQRKLALKGIRQRKVELMKQGRW
jgi:hypothetical protein